MIDFTFGIITGGGKDRDINLIIESIEKQKIPNYEVIIIGSSEVNYPPTPRGDKWASGFTIKNYKISELKNIFGICSDYIESFKIIERWQKINIAGNGKIYD